MGQVLSQNQSGEILYGISNSLDFSKSNSKSSNAKKVNSFLTKSAKKSEDLQFKLQFANNRSLFSLVKTLDGDDEINTRMAKSLVGDAVFYRDYEEQEFIVQKTFARELYIVKHPWENLDWKLTNEHKEILGYKCRKATLFRKADKINIKDRTIIAWFTKELQVKFGVRDYYGLPGQILELNEGPFQYYAKKINIATGLDKEILKPSKGRKMSKEEFEKFAIKIIEEFELSHKLN